MKTVLMEKMSNALQYLNSCLAEREELLRFMAVAVLTRRNLFILGLPGQAKSDAIRRFRSCFKGMNFFGYQLTRETDEEKLFGRLDLASIVPGGVSNSVLRETPSYQAAVSELDRLYSAYEAERDDAKRSILLARMKAASESVNTLREALSMLHSGRPSILTAGKIPQAHLVLLDEIFKANDNALNSLLTALNERVYTNEGEEIPIATISFFAASNEMPNLHNPEDKVYAPLLDRFDLKLITEYIKDKGARQQILRDKLAGSSAVQIPDKITLDELRQMQQEVSEVEVPEAASEMMDDVLCEMRKEKLPISDRKFFGFFPIAQALAWLDGKDQVTNDEIRALTPYLWSVQGDIPKIEQILKDVCLDSVTEKIEDFRAQLNEAYSVFLTDSQADKTRALLKLRECLVQLYKTCAEFRKQTPTASAQSAVDAFIGEMEDKSRQAHSATNLTYITLPELEQLQSQMP